GEDRILGRQVVAVDKSGGVAGMKGPVGPGSAVMRQPDVGRDLHRTREEVFHGQRHRGHRTGKGKWGPAPAWKSGAIVSATVTPEQPATSGKSRKSQQQNEADGDADGERRDIARH